MNDSQKTRERTNDASLNCLLGALVADAASLGLHWLYDTQRIADIAKQHHGQVAFIPPNPTHYDAVPGYFAHAKRSNGMLTQYGETLLLAIKSIAQYGQFDTANYQQAYLETFGLGGTYTGYIDRPTKATINNIVNEQLTPSGTDDDQHPAISTLPAIVVCYQEDNALQDKINAAIQVTNVNDEATHYGWVFAQALQSVLQGNSIIPSLETAAKNAPDYIRRKLTQALESTESNSVAYGEITERACHLKQGMPLAFHILKNSSTFKQAVETNIKAGGDSAGRAIIIGALFGAYTNIESGNGIPLEWILSLNGNVNILTDCKQLRNCSA